MRFVFFPEFLKPEIIPGLPIRWYGLMYLVGFAVTYLLMQYQVKRQNLAVDKDTTLNLFFWGIIGLLVGARLFAVTIYDSSGYYLRNPLRIILPFMRVEGRIVFTGLQGMSYHGGLVGAIVGAVVYCRVKGISALRWGDMIVAGVPLGYTFGRLGNFINGELYGRVTDVAWGVVFPAAERFPAAEVWVQEYASRIDMDISSTALVNLPRHPSQLYEAFFEGVFLWVVLWLFLRKRKPFDGFLVAAYVMGYGIVRFFIEYAREPDKGLGYPIRFVQVENSVSQFTVWNFTTGQILCFLMLVGGALSLFVFRARAARLSERQRVDKARKESLRRMKKRLR